MDWSCEWTESRTVRGNRADLRVEASARGDGEDVPRVTGEDTGGAGEVGGGAGMFSFYYFVFSLRLFRVDRSSTFALRDHAYRGHIVQHAPSTYSRCQCPHQFVHQHKRSSISFSMQPSDQVLLTICLQEQDKGPGDQSTPEDITKAKEAIAAGLKAVRETS